MAEVSEISAPLVEFLDGLVEDLRELIPAALEGEDANAVHDARVATRRLTAAMELVDSATSRKCRKPLEKILKKLRKRLGAIRDIDVMLEHLEKAAKRGHAEAIQWLSERLKQCREDAIDDARQAIGTSRVMAQLGAWWGVREEIQAAESAINILLTQSIHLQLDAFSERAASLGEGDPHSFRIAGKSLRYTLEMAKEQGFKLPAGILTMFKRIQDSLGLWHDFVGLTHRMVREMVEAELGLHNPQIVRRILDLSRKTYARSQRQIARASAIWKEQGEAICRGIRETFPLTVAIEPPPRAIEIPQPPPEGQSAA